VPAILTLTMNPAVDLATTTQRLVEGHKLRCSPPDVHPGGGGINVARVLHRLGADVQALYPAGGCSGQRLVQLLAAEGVPDAAVAIEADTRESFSVVDRSDGREYRFVLPGPMLSAAEWERCLSTIGTLAPPPRWVVASGSLPPGVPEDFYGRLAAMLRGTGSRLVIDTSGPPLAAALQAGVYLAKPSLRELREFTGAPLQDDAQRRDAARALVKAGQLQLVALSLGAEGAMLVSADLALKAPALQVPVASTVGAGDSFLGGLVWALDQGQNLRAAFATAMAAGAAALLAPGTALCRPQDIRRLVGGVQVQDMG
jgi:6-phosphofructokinase 2